MSQLPAVFKVQEARFASIDANISTESKTYIEHVRAIPGHKWEITLISTPLNANDLSRAFGWACSLKGRFTAFTAVIPRYSDTKGVGSGSPVVRTATTQGATAVPMEGFSGPVNGQLLAGDFIKFANHSKVYIVTEDANSNVNGQVTVNIHPQLMKAVPLNTAMVIRDVPFLLRKVRDAQEFKVDGRDGCIAKLELDCREAL
ncbi:MAG: hypothetical protein CML20_10325 [Rheinheimera sp.]|uniref:hypothetical protein n=1 Tax=Arsukibacterium sp. UBA3155 TaxID=1946058 RepID=UPI000C952420|nr:hypothetical protein [Arsukibacterium sp. UBA3155]MAD75169.1 hypothetical protein [Rheinheimera sp.]|tara:strand:- start:26756 stop:27361 length:606 start_codon:yes stop_codon:yes gene_type:complete